MMSRFPDWITRDLAQGIERFIEARDQPPTPRMDGKEAAQTILRDWLQAQGFLELPDGDTIIPVPTVATPERDAEGLGSVDAPHQVPQARPEEMRERRRV